MDSNAPSRGVKGKGTPGDCGIAGLRDCGSGRQMPKSPLAKAAPVRARSYQYGAGTSLAVASDLDDRFIVWIDTEWDFKRPFLSRTLPPRATFGEAQAELDRFARQKGLALVNEEPACRVCGCTYARACVCEETGEPCHWVEADLCSACVGKEDVHHRDAEATEKKDHAKAQRRAGKEG